MTAPVCTKALLEAYAQGAADTVASIAAGLRVEGEERLAAVVDAYRGPLMAGIHQAAAEQHGVELGVDLL